MKVFQPSQDRVKSLVHLLFLLLILPLVSACNGAFSSNPNIIDSSNSSESILIHRTTPTPTPPAANPVATPSPTSVASVGLSLTIQPGVQFAADSYVYNLLADDAPLDPNSANFVTELKRQIQAYYGVASVNIAAYTPNIYIVGPDQPTVSIVASRPWDSSFSSWGAGPLGLELAAVPLPDNFQPASGTDAESVIYQPSTGQYWETWVTGKTGNTTVDSAGRTVDQWQAAWGGHLLDISINPGYFVTNADGYSFGTTAPAIPFLAGMITIEEQQRGVIDHVVGLAIPEPSGDRFLFPAQRTDGTFSGPNTIPEGMIFRLPANLDLDVLPMDPYARMIAKAVQKHGMVIWDTSGVVGFRAENPGPNYPNSDPYGGPGGILNCPAGVDPAPQECWADSNGRLAGFPWDMLQVILPPAK